jgi:hypothetical protein
VITVAIIQELYILLCIVAKHQFVPVEPSPKMDNEAGFGISRSSDAKQFHITYVCMVLDETINICTDQGSVATSAHEERCGPV